MENNEQRVWYKRADMIVGLSALLVSLVAVIVGVYSAYVDRAYARSSVWPSVQIYRSYYKENEQGDWNYSYLILNNGTGPALIKSVQIKLDKQNLKNWSELRVGTGIDQANYSQSQLNKSVIPANQRIVFFQTSDEKLINGLNSIDEKLQFEVCYCSIYDECWQVNRSSVTEEVEKCQIIDKQEFDQ